MVHARSKPGARIKFSRTDGASTFVRFNAGLHPRQRNSMTSLKHVITRPVAVLLPVSFLISSLLFSMSRRIRPLLCAVLRLRGPRTMICQTFFISVHPQPSSPYLASCFVEEKQTGSRVPRRPRQAGARQTRQSSSLSSRAGRLLK